MYKANISLVFDLGEYGQFRGISSLWTLFNKDTIIISHHQDIGHSISLWPSSI